MSMKSLRTRISTILDTETGSTTRSTISETIIAIGCTQEVASDITLIIVRIGHTLPGVSVFPTVSDTTIITVTMIGHGTLIGIIPTVGTDMAVITDIRSITGGVVLHFTAPIIS